MIDKSRNIILALLKKALNPSCKIDDNIFKDAPWPDVIELATNQGVLGVCFDAIEPIRQALGSECAPDMDNLMEWLGQISYMESEYEHHNKVLKRICSDLSDVRILLLKGIGLSKYYPKSSHRPVGDIDIYTYGQQDKLDAFFEKRGYIPVQTVEKHTVTTFDGVSIENHSIYVDAYATRSEKNLQAYLETLNDDTFTAEGYYVPSPIKNYLFLLAHTSRHFSEYPSITLRHLLDWGLFINDERKFLLEQKDFIQVKLKEFGMQKCNDIFTALAQDVIGCDLSAFIYGEVKQEDKDKILNNIFCSKTYFQPKEFFSQTWYKFCLLIGNQWKYKYLAFSFRERIWYSIKWHLGHSKM